jgi:hypothetical protein
MLSASFRAHVSKWSLKDLAMSFLFVCFRSKYHFLMLQVKIGLSLNPNHLKLINQVKHLQTKRYVEVNSIPLLL